MGVGMALVTQAAPPAPRSGEPTVPAPRRREQAAAPGPWLLPAVLAFLVTLHRVGEPLLWRDELTSWDVSGRSPGEVLATARHVDAVVGAYYLVLGAFRHVLGDSPVALRLPSALAMTAAAACVALVGGRLFGRCAGLGAGLLFALIPAVTRFAHEARPYAFAVLAVTLALLLLLRALERPRSPWRWGAYALCLVAVGLFHLIALLCLAGHLVPIARRGRADPRVLWGFGLAVFAAVVALSPLIGLGRAQSGRQISWVGEPGALGLFTLWPQLFHSGACAGALVLLTGAACGQRRAGVALCGVSAFAPPVVLWTLSHGDVSYFHARYLLFTLPAFALLAGAGVAGLARSRASLLGAVALFAVLTLPDHRVLRGPYAHDAGGPDHRAAARIIEAGHRPGDGLVLDRATETGTLALGVRHHLSPRLNPRDVFLAETAAHRHDLLPADCPHPEICLGEEPRLWLVTGGHPTDPTAALPPRQAAALRDHYTVRETARAKGLTVALLVRRT